MMYSTVKRANPFNKEESKYYAQAEYSEEIDVDALAADISKSCTLTPVDIVAVIGSLLDKLPQYLKNSNSVRLNNFGIFRLSFSSKGQNDEKDVSVNDISTPRVLFRPCAQLKKSLSDVSYTKK